jgi:hypothetical protein
MVDGHATSARWFGRCLHSGIFHLLKFQHQLLHVAEANAMRNHTQTTTQLHAALFWRAPGTNSHGKGEFTLQWRNHSSFISTETPMFVHKVSLKCYCLSPSREHMKPACALSSRRTPHSDRPQPPIYRPPAAIFAFLTATLRAPSFTQS